jgi:hypothetical protein
MCVYRNIDFAPKGKNILAYVNYDVTVCIDTPAWHVLWEDLVKRGATPPVYSFFAGIFDTKLQAINWIQNKFPEYFSVLFIHGKLEANWLLGNWCVPQVYLGN